MFLALICYFSATKQKKDFSILAYLSAEVILFANYWNIWTFFAQ